MSEPRRGQAEHFIEHQLPRCGRDQVIAANHFRHALLGIIHDDRQLISRRPRRFPDDKIAALARIDTRQSAKAIVKCGFVSRAKAPRKGSLSK